LELVFVFLGFPLWLKVGAVQRLLLFSIGLSRGFLVSGFYVDFLLSSLSWTPGEYIHKGVALIFPA
jgi:hypothetical protein